MTSIISVLLVCVFTYILPPEIESARILGVFPAPSISHQVVFRAYYLELAKHGHELVIITPNPALPKDRPSDNVTEIDVGKSYENLKKLFEEGQPMSSGNTKRGVILDASLTTKEMYLRLLYFFKEQFEYPEVQQLVQDKSQHFDLIVVESFLDYTLIFANFFKAPVIQFASFFGFPENHEVMGSLSRHPLLYPNFLRNKFRNLSFWEKLKQMYYELKLNYIFEEITQAGTKLIKEQFGSDFPTLKELKDKVEMLFLNSHPILDNNRPVPPSVIYLGSGLHLLPVKELPQDLKEFLDKSTRGVVYVSLGTNVRPSQMDKDFLEVFLETFKALPYDILWKFDGDSLENVPKNVKIQKWFPQRDLPNHPNVKIFVTQGGLQSTDEAINASVPLVGIPIIGDQWHNVNKYVEHGIGISLDGETLTANQLVEAIETVIANASYKRSIERLRTLMYDQPQRPLERAVWWTEYVLRHGGARHLRAPAANMAWTEYLMLDVVIPVVSVLLTILVAAFFTLYYILCKVFCSSRVNKKIKVN